MMRNAFTYRDHINGWSIATDRVYGLAGRVNQTARPCVQSVDGTPPAYHRAGRARMPPTPAGWVKRFQGPWRTP
ncbi:hypothetical protein KRM28CT15_32820 [Krasilnikovia sp. M28-CT-15]